MKRYAIYARVSTDDQDYEMQIHTLKQYAKLRNLNIVEEYEDKGTGSNTNRENYKLLWNDIRKRKIDGVIVWKFDRFSRDTLELIKSLYEMSSLGVDFISYTENIDTTSVMGEAVFCLIAIFAKLELTGIQTRIRAGIKRRIEKGLPHGQQPIEKEIVEKAYKLYESGNSIRKTAKLLNAKPSTIGRYIKEGKENGKLSVI